MAFRGIQTTNIISTDVGLTDPLLILNKSGDSTTDVGFLGKIGPITYAGLVKDSATNEFLLISQIELSATTVNDVNALDASIVKGSITVGTLTADTIVATNVTGNTAGTHTGNVIGSLNGNVTGRLYGDVHGDVTSPTSLEPIITTGPVRDTLTIHDAHIDKIKAPGTNGATILNTSGATTLSGHNVQLTGSLYGDIGDTLANNPVLTVGTGNNDSQLAVTVASIDELTVNDSIDVTNATITGLDISDLTDANNVIQPSDLSTYSTTTASNLFAQQQDLIAKTAAIAAANSYTNGQITTVTSTLQNYANAPTTWVAPKGTEANRPASPVEGQFYFNTDTKIFEGYNGTSWIQLVPSTLLITP
jgi:hypothetical protein